MKVLNYIFYRIYQLMISIGNRDMPAINAALFMTMLLGLNIITILCFIYIFTGQKIDVLFSSKILIVIEYLMLFFVLYALFIRKDKYLEIVKCYEGESNKASLMGRVFAIGYFVLSVALLIFCFFLMIKKNRGEL